MLVRSRNELSYPIVSKPNSSIEQVELILCSSLVPMNRLTSLLAFLLVVVDARADCFDDAASYHTVNPIVLRAIVFHESRFNPQTVNRNSNNSTDIGLAGTNSVHFNELSKYGIAPSDLLVPCKSIYVGAWMLSKKIRIHGNNWTAVGTYHSETPYYRDRYAEIIKKIVENWLGLGYFTASVTPSSPK